MLDTGGKSVKGRMRVARRKPRTQGLGAIEGLDLRLLIKARDDGVVRRVLWIVSEGGGDERMLTAPDSSQGELGHWWPQILVLR